MSCSSPVQLSTAITRKLFHLGLIPTSSIEVSCGRCINCRIVKQSQLSFLAGKEMLEGYKKGLGHSFITLTYDDDHIPINEFGKCTLVKAHLQKFLKRVRRNLDYHYGIKSNAFKYLACGEYGDSFGRCHFHLCLFGIDTTLAKKVTRKSWKYGICDIGVLTSAGVRYVTKYLTKNCPTKEVKELRERYNVQNPFIVHSCGIGKDWINANLDKIANDNFMFNYNGKYSFYPKYILRYVSLKTGKDYRKIIQRSINKKDYSEWKNRAPDLLSLEDYRQFKSVLTLEQNIRILRSKGIPVDPSEVDKISNYKPFSRRDKRFVNKLASQANILHIPF